MKIINQTQNTILAQEFILADTLLKRIRGLLGKKEFKTGQAIVIKPCNSIHSFFMRFTIDVLFLDKDNRVIKILPGFRPFRFSRLYLRAALVVELPPGVISSTSTQEGDIISLTQLK